MSGLDEATLAGIEQELSQFHGPTVRIAERLLAEVRRLSAALAEQQREAETVREYLEGLVTFWCDEANEDRDRAEAAEAALADLRAKVADLYIKDDGNSYPTLWQRNERHPIALVSNADIDHRVWALIAAALAAAPSGEPDTEENR